jgi:serine-type D-Ala-D-Ala carboxypeptidase (penicillin-binding protein 5/6)
LSISRLSIAVLLFALVLVPPEQHSSAPGALIAGAQRPRLAPRPPEVGCEACLVISDSGDVLFQRRAHAELPNASTTKMMTALLTVRAEVLGNEIRVSETAASAGGGGLDLKPGEVWSVEALLTALLLTSSNDAATALAEHVSGSEDAFVADMNAEARRMKLRHTAFVTAHGLDVVGHYSSAADLAVIAEELLDDPTLQSIVARPEADVEGPRGTVTLENSNLLLESYRGAIGIKTGYTQGAGNALVSAAVRGKRTVIGVVIRSADSFADTRALLDYGFARLKRTVLLERGAEVGTVVLDPAGSIRARAARTVRGLAPTESLEVSFEPASSYDLPLAPNDVVGSIVLGSGGRVLGRVPAVTHEAIADPRPSWVGERLATVLSWGQWIDGLTE